MASPSSPLSALWKEAIELFKTEAELSEREVTDLESSHTPDQVLQVVAHPLFGKPSKKELRQRVRIQKTVTVVLNIFGVIDTALNLAQVVQPAMMQHLSKGIPRDKHFFRCDQTASQSYNLPLCITQISQALKGLWNVYDEIQQQFLAIHSFLERAKINLSTHSVPAGLDLVVVKVLKQMLHICAIATQYAKAGSFKRSTPMR
jgi:hypothetical protein